jgi:hypothetical protein
VKHLSAILLVLLLTTVGYSQKIPAAVEFAVEKSKVNFFPNPATTTITFQFSIPIEKGYSLQVYSFLGRQVATVPVVNSRVSMNVSELMRGVYVFQLRDNNGRVLASNKFQVSR